MGEWRELVTQVWETNVTPCECCGQVVARRVWVEEIEGTERRFCGPACEDLYRRHVLARDSAGHR